MREWEKIGASYEEADTEQTSAGLHTVNAMVERRATNHSCRYQLHVTYGIYKNKKTTVAHYRIRDVWRGATLDDLLEQARNELRP